MQENVDFIVKCRFVHIVPGDLEVKQAIVICESDDITPTRYRNRKANP